MEIKEFIPQRMPFLFIDKIIEINSDKILTSYFIRGDEYFLKGHFPDNPIMPGVILQEALFQSGAALMGKNGRTNELGVVTKVTNARFKQLVKPKDELIMEVILNEQLGNAYFFKGKTRVKEKVILSLEFTCAQIMKE